jgi:beta-xylosidase
MVNRLACTSLLLCTLALSGASRGWAQNPLVTDQFTADPTARVFEGRIYVYPSHDINVPGKGRAGWFAMEDYHVFSSENLVDWKDQGVILDQTQVPWLGRKSYDMWAPDCVFKNGKYFFYFPTGGRIGVAKATRPYGPFTAEPNAIQGVRGVDPGVLIDKDGSAYLFWSGIWMAKLKDNMVELDSKPQQVQNLPRPGLIEGPFPFERNGIYYLTYPHVQNKIERLEYSVAKSPLGPYEWKGVIMDESTSGCWTNHQSVVEYKGQWYLFYHDKDLSPSFDKNRSIHADYLSFNEDGTIQRVTPTLRGVGIVTAKSRVQIDRYSAISKEGATVSFLNEANKFEGWKIALGGRTAWVQFNRVDFGNGDLTSVNARSASSTGGSAEVRLDKVEGPVLARVDVEKGSEWKVVKTKLANVPSGVHDLIVTFHGPDEKSSVELDWLSFE